MGSHSSSSSDTEYDSEGRVGGAGGGAGGVGDLATRDLDDYVDVVDPSGADLEAGAVIEGPDGEDMLVVESADGVDAALAVESEQLREGGVDDWRDNPSVLASMYQDGNLDADAEVVGADSANVSDLPRDWVLDSGTGADVFGDAVEDFDDDRAGFERYRETLKGQLAASGLRVPDQVDATPAERIESYLRNARSDLSREFSVRGDRAGGLPDASFDLENQSHKGGGARGVDEGDLPDSGDHVFKASYKPGKNQRKELFRRERATYAFLDAAGARVPRHEFDADPDRSDIYAQSMSREISGPLVRSVDSDLKDEVDSEQAMDHMAMQLLGGNFDPHAKNVIVTDGNGATTGPGTTADHDRAGQFVCHDLDRGASRMDDAARRGMSEGLRKGKRSLTKAGVDVDRDELRRHTAEIAREMIESGDLDRVTDAVAEVDPKRAKIIAQNVGYFALNPEN